MWRISLYVCDLFFFRVKKLRGFFSFGLVIISWNKNPSAINVMGGLPYLIFHNFKDMQDSYLLGLCIYQCIHVITLLHYISQWHKQNIIIYIVFTYEFIFPFRKKCANVVNEIFCFLFLICLLSNTCSYIPVSFASRANYLQYVKHYEKTYIIFYFALYHVWNMKSITTISTNSGICDKLPWF